MVGGTASAGGILAMCIGHLRKLLRTSALGLDKTKEK
jgi:hypothetical protein